MNGPPPASNAAERPVWRIGPDELTDNYRGPFPTEHTWRVGQAVPRWPLFHPSEADPDSGYRTHPYTIVFDLTEPAPTYLLRLEYLAIAPRLADLELRIGDSVGRAHLRPGPSLGHEIRLHAGLHTSIYAEGRLEVVLPGGLFRAGENRLTLIARDDGEVLRVTNPQAIERLDRMANGAGFIYQELQLLPIKTAPPTVRALAVVPGVVYTHNTDGVLLEDCALHLELGGPIRSTTFRLEADGHAFELRLPDTPFGHVRVPFELPDGAGEVHWTLTGEVNGSPFERRGSFRRRRKWRVFVAPHAHVDIGYTHRQWEVAERLNRNVEDALGLIGQHPDAFAYHLDCAFPLEGVLETRSKTVLDRLNSTVQDGRFGVSGLYVDALFQLSGLEDLVRNALHGNRLLERIGARTDFAAVVDVASLPCALPDVLYGAGLKYLVHANNQDRGPFRLNGGLHRKNPFYWRGPAGGRVLVWLARMYCELRKVCGSPPVPDAAARGLGLWLDEFEREDYAPDAVLLYGMEADNTDLDPQPAAFIRGWNDTHAYPKLIPSVVSDFFREVEAAHGQRFETLRGDGGAYWEDGALSSLEATSWAREAQASLPAAERLEALAALLDEDAAFPTAHFDAAWRELLLFDEHTWGAFLSGPEPEARLARDQWALKENFARQARLWAERLLHAAACRHSLRTANAGREVVVYNPHSFPVGGAFRVEIAANEALLDADTRERVPMRAVRVLDTQAVVEALLGPMPGLSYRRFVLERAERNSEPAETILTGQSFSLENARHRLRFDLSRGCAVRWLDKRLGRELVEARDAFGLGQYVYARGGEGTRLVSNRADLPDGDPELLTEFRLERAWARRWAFGSSLSMRGTVPDGVLEIEWTLHDALDEIELGYRLEKRATTAKEAAYVAFPLALPDARVRSDAALGWVDWDADTLPGACQEWLPLQTGVLLEGEGATVHLASPQVPLFCVGDVVRGRWPRKLALRGARVFSYVLNNYWHTNYPASQGGLLAWSYRLSSDAVISPEQAFRRGWAARRPLYAHRVSYQDFRAPRPPYDDPAGATLARVLSEGDAVILSALKGARDGAGFIARFQETSGVDRTARFALPDRAILRAWRTDLLEHDLEPLPVGADGSLELTVPAWGVVTVRLVLAHD